MVVDNLSFISGQWWSPKGGQWKKFVEIMNFWTFCSQKTSQYPNKIDHRFGHPRRNPYAKHANIFCTFSSIKTSIRPCPSIKVKFVYGHVHCPWFSKTYFRTSLIHVCVGDTFFKMQFSRGFFDLSAYYKKTLACWKFELSYKNNIIFKKIY